MCIYKRYEHRKAIEAINELKIEFENIYPFLAELTCPR